jgi:hypothetical protein
MIVVLAKDASPAIPQTTTAAIVPKRSLVAAELIF